MGSSDAGLAALLIAGGDARLVIDRDTGRNKYFCPPRPAPDIVCFASCTGSPITTEGWRAAAESLRRMQARCGSHHEREVLQLEATELAAALGAALGTTDVAQILLTPSGTDATLLLTCLLVAERRGRPIVSIMAAHEETGSGVPLAAAGRHFCDLAADGRRVPRGESLHGLPRMETLNIPLRCHDGRVRRADAIAADFAAAVAAASPAHPVVHLMECSKSGLRAPQDIPRDADVVVDACQGRISATRLRAYLSRGWPVLLTGSKYYGAPTFCGAVLFPAERLAAIDRRGLPAGLAAYGYDAHAAQPAANMGTVLRWAAALDEIKRCAKGSAPGFRMSALAEEIDARIRATAGIRAVPMPEDDADAAADRWPQSIHTFAVCDPADENRLLTMAELRLLYAELADDGILVGQPVAIGRSYGALRIAIGAPSLRDPAIEVKLQRLFSAIERRIRGNSRESRPAVARTLTGTQAAAGVSPADRP